jgi:hypothetical protein
VLSPGPATHLDNGPSREVKRWGKSVNISRGQAVEPFQLLIKSE